MSDGFECSDCGKSFDTKRGLNIHRSQVHPDDETRQEETENENTDYQFSLGLREVVAGSFTGGLLFGVLLTALFFTASGMTFSPSMDNGETGTITQQVDGINADVISSLMDENNEDYLNEIESDRSEGQASGITGTPGFVVYETGSSTGTKLTGAHPYGNFQSIIESKMNGDTTGNVSTSSFAIADEPSIGNENAQVTIVYWYDYQCPFCKQFETQTLDRIRQNYVETGEARIVFKNFAFLGPDSRTAAIASEAIWDRYPERWLDWHMTVYENQGSERSGWASKENLVG